MGVVGVENKGYSLLSYFSPIEATVSFRSFCPYEPPLVENALKNETILPIAYSACPDLLVSQPML